MVVTNADRLKGIVDRIERVEEDIRGQRLDLKELYREAKQAGFLPAALRKIVAERRGQSRRQKKVAEAADIYRVALGMTPLEAAIEEQKKAEGEAAPGPDIPYTLPGGYEGPIKAVEGALEEAAAYRGVEAISAGEAEKIDKGPEPERVRPKLRAVAGGKKASPHAGGSRKKELQGAIAPARGRRPPKPDQPPTPPAAA